MNVDRMELIEELDLALAALRRVIVRAIDAGTSSSATTARPRAAKIEAPSAATPARMAVPVPVPVPAPVPVPRVPAPRPAAPPLPRDDVVRNDIAVCFDPARVTFAEKTVEVSRRQAELVAVLAGAMSVGWLDRKVLAQKAWPDLASSSGDTYLSTTIEPLTNRLASIGVRLTSERGFGLRLSVDAGAQS